MTLHQEPRIFEFSAETVSAVADAIEAELVGKHFHVVREHERFETEFHCWQETKPDRLGQHFSRHVGKDYGSLGTTYGVYCLGQSHGTRPTVKVSPGEVVIVQRVPAGDWCRWTFRVGGIRVRVRARPSKPWEPHEMIVQLGDIGQPYLGGFYGGIPAARAGRQRTYDRPRAARRRSGA